MLAVADTSVIISAVLTNSAGHNESVAALATAGARAAGHAWIEAYSVLTRLPPDVRLNGPDALRVLASAIGGVRHLSQTEQKQFQKWLAGSDVVGGAVYDALVGFVAKVASVPLITRDARAIPTYRQLGIDVLVLDPQLT